MNLGTTLTFEIGECFSFERCNRMSAGNVRETFFEAISDLQLLHVRWWHGLQ